MSMAGETLRRTEAARVACVRRSGLLDGELDPAVGALVERAGRTLDFPLSFFSIVDQDSQVIRVGSPEVLGSGPRAFSFCTHTIASPDESLVVEDATLDTRFRDLPAVTGRLGLRAYGGTAIHSSDGYRIGALCVGDRRPRAIGPSQMAELRRFADALEPLLHAHGAHTAPADGSSERLRDWRRGSLYDLVSSADIVLIRAERRAGGLVVLEANDAALRMVGAPSGWCAPGKLADLLGIAPEDEPSAEAEAAARAGGACRVEMEGRRSGRDSYWCSLRLVPLGARDLLLVGQEVTELMLRARQSETVQSILAKVFVGVDAAAAVIRWDGRLEMVNPKFATLLGYTAERLVGGSCIDLLTPESQQVVKDARERQLDDAEAFAVDVVCLHADGRPVPVRYVSAVIAEAGVPRLGVITLSERPVDGAGGASAQPPVPVEVAGRIRLIGLESVKETLGDRWPAMAERMYRSAEHVLRKHLGPDDSYARNAEGGFLVCFGGLTDGEAALRATAIGNEIRRRLIGDGEASQIAQVSAITTSLPPSADGTPPSTEALERLFDERMAEIERTARVELREAMDAAGVAFIPARRGASVVAHLGVLHPDTASRIDAALMKLPLQDRVETDLDLLQLRLVALGMLSGPSKGPILLKVGAEVLASRGRTDRYIEVAAKMNPAIRARLILLLGMQPQEVHALRLRECIGRFRPFCREVGFHGPKLDFPPPSPAVGTTVMAVDYRDLMVSEAALKARLVKYVPVLTSRRGRLLVTDVPDLPAADLLTDAGVDLVAMTHG